MIKEVAKWRSFIEGVLLNQMKSHVMKKVSGLAIGSSMLILSMLPAASAFAATAPSITLTEQGYNNIAAKVQPGGSVTFSASANGVTDPMYQFWVEEPNGSWQDVQNYSSTNTYTLSNVASGDYLVTAYVLSAANVKAGDYSAATNAESNGQQDVEGVFVDSTVTLSTPTAAATSGQAMTISATATNIYNPLYQFWYETPAGQWVQSGNYQSSNSFTFTPTESGTYTFIAYAKSPLALNNPEGASYSNVTTGTTSSTVGVPTLSTMVVTGATTGTGTQSSPYLALNGASLTYSTTLVDATGNPMVGVGVTYDVSESNELPSPLPTVTSNGATVAGTSATTAETYTVYTNSAGQASMELSGPAGTTAGYTVMASAPFQSNGAAISTSPVTVEYVANGQVGISPLTTSSSPYESTLPSSGVVPITVTLPPVNSVAQTNVPVNFTSAGPVGFMSSAAGSNLGTTETIYTNSAGQATAYVDSASIGSDTVTVSSTSSNPTVASSVYVNWSQVGIPTQIANLTSSGTPMAGSNVTWTGTVEDAAGNPVPNATLLVAAMNSGGVSLDNGTDSYVSGTTTTAFPEINAGTLTGVSANSNYGDIVTANASGQFSMTVTNSSVQTDNYYFYAAENGAASALLATSPNLSWMGGTTLASIGAYGSWSAENSAGAPPATSVSGLSVAAGTTGTVFLEPWTSTAPLTGTSVTYELTATNGADITALTAFNSGSSVGSTGPVSPSVPSLQVTESYSNGVYTLSYPGESTTETSITGTSPIFGVGVENSTPGNSVLTVTSGTISATATFDFISGLGAYVENFPVQTYINPGTPATITYTVEDAAGNPVSDAPSTIDFTSETPAGLWITQVNGVTLQSSFSGTLYPTPIPLSDAGMSAVSGNYSVNQSNVAYWQNGQTYANVYTNSSGVVSLTVQPGPITVYDPADASTGYVTTVGTVQSGVSANVYTPTGAASIAAQANGNVFLSNSATYSTTTGYNNIGSINW